jgi:hypothetical protein
MGFPLAYIGRATTAVLVCAGAAFSLVGCGISGTASAKSPGSALSPSAVLHALSTARYPHSQLPAGYTSAKVARVSVFVGAPEKYGLLGVVTITADRPGIQGLIYYSVHSTPADARASVNHPGLGANGRIVARRVPGFSSLPGILISGTVTVTTSLGGSFTRQLTAAGVGERNVVVLAATIGHGAHESELPLLRSAVRHLQAVEGHRHAG